MSVPCTVSLSPRCGLSTHVPPPPPQILTAHQALPDYTELAEKVQACFSKVWDLLLSPPSPPLHLGQLTGSFRCQLVDTSVSSVVWSYIMQRGYRSDRSSSLTELCKILPSEIFKPCLSKVLEVCIPPLAPPSNLPYLPFFLLPPKP